jgi:hypothetical protein
MLTCRACGVEPLAWLRHVLTELPQRPHGADIGDLLPFNFKNKPEPTPSFRAMLPCAIYDRRPVNVIRVL